MGDADSRCVPETIARVTKLLKLHSIGRRSPARSVPRTATSPKLKRWVRRGAAGRVAVHQRSVRDGLALDTALEVEALPRVPSHALHGRIDEAPAE